MRRGKRPAGVTKRANDRAGGSKQIRGGGLGGVCAPASTSAARCGGSVGPSPEECPKAANSSPGPKRELAAHQASPQPLAPDNFETRWTCRNKRNARSS
eukprot:CAMPEP_0177578080 /NCGR_PEP_ID=MMETSP0419_2-20121207/136_1 /TAXON_ID=582737 /ORGANISM="Tetraselmis sp., Strain GSL018" /LENGTH=98 /DNA_ID=CAMNT_0019066457 /DNA_START=107 /DNA_END=403 /DNA_ORIENTATION=-